MLKTTKARTWTGPSTSTAKAGRAPSARVSACGPSRPRGWWTKKAWRTPLPEPISTRKSPGPRRETLKKCGSRMQKAEVPEAESARRTLFPFSASLDFCILHSDFCISLMTPEERTLITGLFDRLRAADANAPAKDREAEELIRQLTSQAPSRLISSRKRSSCRSTRSPTRRRASRHSKNNSPGQQQQQQTSAGSSGGGFLSGLVGGHSSNPPPAPPQTPPPMPVQTPAPPYPSTVNMAPSAGGGFLRGALSTAAGVAGGALLFQGIENLLGHNSGPFGSLWGAAAVF